MQVWKEVAMAYDKKLREDVYDILYSYGKTETAFADEILARIEEEDA